MDMKQDVRPSKNEGGGCNSLPNSMPDSQGQDSPEYSQNDCKEMPDSSTKKPYFLLSNFRPLKQPSSVRGSELVSSQPIGPQTFKKNDTKPSEDVEDLNEYGCSEKTNGHKTLQNSKYPFKYSTTLDRRTPCKICQNQFEEFNNAELVCPDCYSQFIDNKQSRLYEHNQGYQFRNANEEQNERISDYKDKFVSKVADQGVYNIEKAKNSLLNQKKDSKLMIIKKDPVIVKKSKCVCSNEQGSTLKNLQSTSVSNIKLAFIPMPEKKISSGKGIQSRNSPVAHSQNNTLQNQDKKVAEDPKSKPDSKKSIKSPLIADTNTQPSTIANLPSNSILQIIKKTAPLLSKKNEKSTISNIKPSIVRPNSRSSSSNDRSKDKRTESSNKSDEQLCRAFSVDRSLTMTAKVSSVKMSESMETDPEVERSMRYEENRTLSFLNEEDEILDKVHEQPKAAIKKNRLKMTSGNFLIGKKYSACEDKAIPPNPLIDVISNTPFPYYRTQMYLNMSANLSHNETSMYSTQDSRPGQNKSLNYEQLRQGCESISDSKPNSSLSFAPPLRPFPTIPQYGMYSTEIDPRFIREKAGTFNPDLLSNGYETIQDNFGLQQFDINQNLSMVSIPSADDDAQKKNRARKCQPVINGKEFGIQVDSIYEVRKTTLMIKNIPNRYTKEMMLETIDKKFKDRYNFFYLPIDFDNSCNVGYAFINFIDLDHIRNFVLEFNGSHWPNFKSDKICEITYARIQGKEACIQHFKDSSLMKQEVS
jgi:hypothetical protein